MMKDPEDPTPEQVAVATNETSKNAEEAKFKRLKMLNCGCVVIALIALVVSLSVGLTKTNESTVDKDMSTSLPPMENLKLLYDELPEKTKESLYNRESPQYQAWEWLLGHPSITTYPEWRKKQIFAMASVFYSFAGPDWPKTNWMGRWMRTSTSECSWVLSDRGVREFARWSPDAYGLQDYQPCNEDGEIQTLVMSTSKFPSNATLSIPPEIGLLKSLRIIEVKRYQFKLFEGSINANLSDVLVPELIQLPKLELLKFHQIGVKGPIPEAIGLMTGLRHLILGGDQVFSENELTSTIPSTIGKMTSLELLDLGSNVLTGSIPSELGHLTRVTSLHLGGNSLTGFLPTQLGLLSSITSLHVSNNVLNGSIPSEVGSMTSAQVFWLQNNAFSGPLPSELGLMTDAQSLFLGSDLNETFLGSYHLNFEGSQNDFSGYLPTELWGLSRLEHLFLPNLPNLYGSIATETMLNLTLLRLEGSPNLSGTVPEQLCLSQDTNETLRDFLWWQALDFDCSDMFCGCNCTCDGGNF